VDEDLLDLLGIAVPVESEPEPECLALWPENFPVVRLFITVAGHGQWCYSGGIVPQLTGLNGVYLIHYLQAINHPPDTMQATIDDMMIVAGAYARAMRERYEKNL